MKKLVRFQLLTIFTLILATNLYSQENFPGLSPEESQALFNGDTVTRILKNEKDLLINKGLIPGIEFIDTINRLKPNYISEVAAFLPVEDGSDIDTVLEKLAAKLTNIEAYAAIPYFSKKWNKIFDLYDWLNSDSFEKTTEGFSAVVTQNMKPFGEMDVEYKLSLFGQELVFTSENISAISYKRVKAVKPGRMKWFLTAFEYEDKLLFYGVGAAKAFDMFGTLRSRLEPAFVGRAEAFFVYMLTELE